MGLLTAKEHEVQKEDEFLVMNEEGYQEGWATGRGGLAVVRS